MNIKRLNERREKILAEMRTLRTMRPGTVSEQFLKVPHKGESEPVERGPYYLWQYYEQGKPRRKRLTTPKQVRQAREDVRNHKRFVQLCKAFEELTQQLGELERTGAASQEALKKGLKSPSNKARK